MESFNLDRYNALKVTERLPSPKGVALAILNLLKQDDVTVHDISHVIQTDPALSARLIKFSNSVHFGIRRPIVSISEAVLLIGLPMVRQLVLGFSVLSDFRSGRCTAFNYEEFWSCSLATAIANQALSARSKGPSDETFVCGLLSKVGSLALASLFPEEYAQVLTAAAGKPANELLNLEQERFEADHNVLTAGLLKDWGFPRIFIETAFCHEDADNGYFPEGSRGYFLAHSLNLAARLAKLCLMDESSKRRELSRLYVMGARLGMDSEELLILCDHVAHEWQEWGRILEVPTKNLSSFVEMAAALPQVSEIYHPEKQENESEVESSLRILVVDHDDTAALSLKNILVGCGHTVFTASNGSEALRQAVEYNPQMIISDWKMPDMEGSALCKILRLSHEARGIYFILMIPSDKEDQLVESFEAGVDDVIVKPFCTKNHCARLRAGQRVIQLQEELGRDRDEVRRFASELAVTNRRLQRLATTDFLTLLGNRRFGMERLEQEWSASERNGRPLTCMLIDLDHFKEINDTYGHDAGDETLKQAASILENSSREYDDISRIGGEEFMLICPGTDLEAGKTYAERIRKSFETAMFNVGQNTFPLTISVGVAERKPSMSGFNDLVKAADKALYLSKQQGRNRVVAASMAPAP
ncbi:MAG: HDOD domain-containing protein [Gammaproteobacteria bacterium]|nr:HDOD domain-containing protein [Gammaproteobacteria bacterium]